MSKVERERPREVGGSGPFEQHFVNALDPAGRIEQLDHPGAVAVAAAGQRMAAGGEHQFVERVGGRDVERDRAMVVFDGVLAGPCEQSARRRGETPGNVASSTTCEPRVIA